jgi:hypothetical protein
MAYYQILAGGDDACKTATTYSSTSNYTYFGKDDDGNAKKNYLRYKLDNIPKDATIVTAYLSFIAYAGYSDAFSTYIEVYETGSMPSIATEPSEDRWATKVTYDLGSQSWTKDTWYDSPSIVTLVQHIVNRSDWLPGNYIGFYIGEGDATTGEKRVSWSYDYFGLSMWAPSLTVVADVPYEKLLADLNTDTTYYFRAKAQSTVGWGYGVEKSFTTLLSKTATVLLGLLPTISRNVATTRASALLKSGARVYDLFSVIGLFKESLARVGSIASYKPSLRLFRTAFATARARATSFPMGPARKIFMKLAAAKRFILDFWVKSDGCGH